MPDKTPSAVSGFYDGIFHYYGTVNAFLTVGLDACWRREAAKLALASSPEAILDVCCGTGDLTIELFRLSGGRSAVIGTDFNASMLAKARSRNDRIPFLEAEAGALPFPDGTFDALTISFATRNLGSGRDLIRYFSEFHRVLKPGGVFVHLETSRPSSRFTRFLFHAHVKLMTGITNIFFPKTRSAYSFLSASIKAFPPAAKVSDLILQAGFRTVATRPLLFGAIAIHTAVK